MSDYLLRRLLQVAIVVFLTSVATFFLLFVEGMVHGDFGRSLFMQTPALGVVIQRVPATLDLAAVSVTMTLVFSIGLGIAAAVWRNSAVDYITSLLAFFGQAMPSFWLGILLILVFAVRLHWLPYAGIGGWQHLLLPSVTLGLYLSPIFARLTRSRMIDVLAEDYIRTARAKGVTNRVVWFKHALRNAAGPIVTMLGLQTGRIFGGIVIIEAVFGWPGVASLIVTSIERFDFPVVEAGVVMLALIIALSNLLADVVVVTLDPRVRAR
jgi:ABC-type dipeptide/oligopeptide/nickel transport system permease component